MNTQKVIINSLSIMLCCFSILLLRKEQIKINNYLWIKLLGWLLVLLQLGNCFYQLFINGIMLLDHFDIISISLLLTIIIILLLDKKSTALHLLLAILPVNILVYALIITDKQGLSPSLLPNSLAFAHMILSVFSCDILIVATVQGIFLGIQEYLLHNHCRLLALPALETMEILLFRLLYIGVTFLSLTLLSGFIFSVNNFNSAIISKIILTFFSWLAFVVLLFGKWLFGWRGYTTTYWILAGSSFLVIASFTSWKNFLL